jgi:HK97 family phage portal protein
MAIFDLFKKSSKEEQEMASISQFIEQQFSEIGKGSVIWSEVNFQAIVEEAYRKNPDVYSVVSFIANKAADLPFEICDSEGNKVESGPVYDALMAKIYQANSYQTWREFLLNVYTNRLVTGNAYVYSERGETALTSGMVTTIESLPSAFVDVVSGNDSMLVSGYKLNSGNSSRPFDADKIVHLKNAQIDYGAGRQLYGQSPLEACFRSVQTANEATNSQKASLENQGALGVLFNKGVDFSSGKDAWGIDEANRAKEMLKKIRRSSAANSIGVATGDLGYINFGASPVDMGVVEYLNVTLSDVCNAYNLDAGLFGRSDASTFNNQREYRKRAYTDAILPLANEIAAGLTKVFCTEGFYIKPNTDNVEELNVDKGELMVQLQPANFLTINEKRAMLGLPEIEGDEADTLLVGTNVVPLDLAGFDGKE